MAVACTEAGRVESFVWFDFERKVGFKVDPVTMTATKVNKTKEQPRQSEFV